MKLVAMRCHRQHGLENSLSMQEARLAKVVVTRKIESQVMLHNVIGEIAFAIYQRCQGMTRDKDGREFILDAINGTILLAMLNEGFADAVGVLRVPSWNEGETAKKKLKILAEEFLRVCLNHVEAYPACRR